MTPALATSPSPLPGHRLFLRDGVTLAVYSVHEGRDAASPIYRILPLAQGRGLMVRVGWAAALDALRGLAG
jgi:hypothetical protein